MTVKRGTGVTLWRQIQEAVEGEIASGALKPGDRLPTEYELAERFRVNRHTVRRALSGLEEKALVRIEQGRGTFVQENVIDYAVKKRTRFSENVSRQAKTASGRLVEAWTEPASAAIAEALALADGTLVAVIRAVGEVDGRPIGTSDHHFSADRFPTIADAYRRTHSITKSLEELGVSDYVRKVTRVTSRMPTAEEAKMLQQPRTRPILVAESVNVTPDGQPVEFGITRFAGDRVQILFEP